MSKRKRADAELLSAIRSTLRFLGGGVTTRCIAIRLALSVKRVERLLGEDEKAGIVRKLQRGKDCVWYLIRIEQEVGR